MTLIQTDDGDSLFAVMRNQSGQDSTAMDVWHPDDDALHRSVMSGHSTLRSFLMKFFLLKDLGNSLMFMTFLENEDVSNFHVEATALYGPPAMLGQNTYLYEGENAVVMLTGDDEPTMDLWVLDQAEPWARNAEFLRMTELTEEAILKWSQPR